MLGLTLDCLDDTTVLALVSGRLDEGALARADAHLDTCDDCRALVVTVAQGATGGNPGETDSADLGVMRPGARVGRYVVEDLVGNGAMGMVHAARDPELHRRVALKLLRAEASADPGAAREQLLREAQAMARLQHPNVVTVFEVGAAGDRVFLAMELVEGATLRTWMGSTHSWEEVCEAMEQVGRGLAAAHAAGLVHRDVKPDNILVEESGRARIGDFGLACAEGAEEGREAPRDPLLSRTGTLVGTPAYMAPEALRGESADARSDQFSFCTTFFEALHGERPFSGDTLSELREAIARGRTIPLRGRAPSWLNALLKRGLAAQPGDRFPTMTALLEAIASRRRRGRPWRWVGATAAVALTSVVLFAIWKPAAKSPSCDGGAARVATIWNDTARARVSTALSGGAPSGSGNNENGGNDGASRVIGALDRWASGWAVAHDDTCSATRVRGEQSEQLLDIRMQCLERRRSEAGLLVEQLGRPGGPIARFALDAVTSLPDAGECRDLDTTGTDPLPRDPVAAAAAERALSGLAEARAALFAGNSSRALALANELSTQAAQSGHDPTRAEVDLVRAEALRLGGDARGAEEAAQASLSAAERGRDNAAAARAWLLLIALAGERRDLPAAEERARHAEAALARAGNPRVLVARLDHARGLVAEGLGHLEEAERYLSAALDLRRSLHGDDDLEVARSLAALGGVARARGHLEEARQKIAAALTIDERRLGPGHPDVARDLHNLGGVLRLTGDLEDALQTYTRALEIRRATLGEDHVDTALTHNSIGLVWMARGRIDEAEQQFTTALAVLAKARHGDRAIALHNLALVAQRRGDHPTALRLFAEAEAVYRDTLGDTSEALKHLQEDRRASEQPGTKHTVFKPGIRPAPVPSTAAPPTTAPPPAGPSTTVPSAAATSTNRPSPTAAPTPSSNGGMYGAPRPWDRN